MLKVSLTTLICLVVLNCFVLSQISENNVPTTTTRSKDDNKETRNENKSELDLKNKLSLIIDKYGDKIKNKNYKNDFILYVLSYNDKKQEYNDVIDNNNYNKILQKYQLYIESDLYINDLNKNVNIPMYSHNKFSDWSMEEKKSILIDVTETETRRRIRRLIPKAPPVVYDAWCVKMPGSIDQAIFTTRTSYENEAQPIKDQGRTCGSCWAFASIGQYELNDYLYNDFIQTSYSEQYILDCAENANTTCYGGYPKIGNKLLINGACPTSSYSNYDGIDRQPLCRNCSTNKSPTSHAECFTQESTGYDSTSIEFWNVIATAAQHHSLSFVMQISRNFFHLGATSPNLHMSPDPNPSFLCNASDYYGLHAMSIYGQSYGNALLLRNSWGTSWANNGWFWFNKNARISCKFNSNNQMSFNDWP
jgi:hypothetical protein